jgi:hypothetical protein
VNAINQETKQGICLLMVTFMRSIGLRSATALGSWEIMFVKVQCKHKQAKQFSISAQKLGFLFPSGLSLAYVVILLPMDSQFYDSGLLSCLFNFKSAG